MHSRLRPTGSITRLSLCPVSIFDESVCCAYSVALINLLRLV